jgi:hypothetical protein
VKREEKKGEESRSEDEKRQRKYSKIYLLKSVIS